MAWKDVRSKVKAKFRGTFKTGTATEATTEVQEEKQITEQQAKNIIEFQNNTSTLPTQSIRQDTPQGRINFQANTSQLNTGSTPAPTTKKTEPTPRSDPLGIEQTRKTNPKTYTPPEEINKSNNQENPKTGINSFSLLVQGEKALYENPKYDPVNIIYQKGKQIANAADILNQREGTINAYFEQSHPKLNYESFKNFSNENMGTYQLFYIKPSTLYEFTTPKNTREAVPSFLLFSAGQVAYTEGKTLFNKAVVKLFNENPEKVPFNLAQGLVFKQNPVPDRFGAATGKMQWEWVPQTGQTTLEGDFIDNVMNKELPYASSSGKQIVTSTKYIEAQKPTLLKNIDLGTGSKTDIGIKKMQVYGTYLPDQFITLESGEILPIGIRPVGEPKPQPLLETQFTAFNKNTLKEVKFTSNDIIQTEEGTYVKINNLFIESNQLENWHTPTRGTIKGETIIKDTIQNKKNIPDIFSKEKPATTEQQTKQITEITNPTPVTTITLETIPSNQKNNPDLELQFFKGRTETPTKYGIAMSPTKIINIETPSPIQTSITELIPKSAMNSYQYNTKTIILPKTSIISKSKTDQTIIPGSTQQIIPRSAQRTNQVSRQDLFNEQIQKQTTEQIQLQETINDISLSQSIQPITSFKSGRNKPFKDFSPKSTENPSFAFDFNTSTLDEAFDVFVRKKGKFVKINRLPLIKEEAIGLGSFNVGNTARATFKLLPTAERVGQSFSKTGRMEDFYQSRRKPQPLTWIEKANRRIKSPGEKQEITQAGRNANKKRGWSL